MNISGKSPLDKPILEKPEEHLSEKSQRQRRRRESDDSGGSSSSSSSDDDEEEESSSGSSSDSSSDSDSSEEEAVMAKPVFVPKHKRNVIVSEAEKLEQEEARIQREQEREAKRKMESRMMVAQQLAAAAETQTEEEVDEESGGATNAPPNDDDDLNPEHERALWEMRELERLLATLDAKNAREAEILEYERRKKMTDEEVLQEDMKAGRFSRPGQAREQRSGGGAFMQRFYHRGAYYMDEEEWDESDVRHKAAEYARAATGEDKIDKSVLPEVMQVKKFGFASQNTKYKGLAKEDTTDKRMEMLPLKRKEKR